MKKKGKKSQESDNLNLNGDFDSILDALSKPVFEIMTYTEAQTKANQYKYLEAWNYHDKKDKYNKEWFVLKVIPVPASDPQFAQFMHEAKLCKSYEEAIKRFASEDRKFRVACVLSGFNKTGAAITKDLDVFLENYARL